MGKQTRQALLDVMYEHMHTKGYHATSLSEVLSEAGVHKGSMYHFFESKKAMALVAIEEKMHAEFEAHYLSILEHEPPFMPHLIALLKETSGHDFKRGCPLANLVQELSNVDEAFHQALKGVYAGLKELFRIVFNQMVKRGELKACDTLKLALFAVSVVEGGLLCAKASGDKWDYIDTIDAFALYLESLQP